MKLTIKVAVILLLINPVNPSYSQRQSLRVLNINVWSGLTYEGTMKMGEYETPGHRERRFLALLSQIRVNHPDIILLQEANPVGSYASRLADSLSYDEIHFVCNAGIKLGPLGIPSNLKEGQVILARKELELEKYDVWKHSGSLGINSDNFNFHLDESIYSLVGKIKVDGKPVFIINAHLFSVFPMDSSLKQVLYNEYKRGKITEEEYNDAYEEWSDGVQRQKDEMKDLIANIKELPKNVPVIAGGDFNCSEKSTVMRAMELSGGFINTLKYANKEEKSTWDLQRNLNARYEAQYDRVHNESFEILDSISSYYDTRPRNIDHILISRHFSIADIKSSKVTLDSEINGVHASDHFGVLTEINVTNALKKVPKETDELGLLKDSKLEPLPILTYDTDVGLGYGFKLFVLNKLKHNESFDATFFHSTKGERWYRFVFSIPDFELRQGKTYPVSLDLAVDYDKWINNNFFGIGSNSSYDSIENYQKEPLEFSLTFGRAFTKNIITQLGVRYKTIRNSEFSPESKLINILPDLNRGKVTYGSLFANIKYDTRNSFVNPSQGLVIQGEAEYAPKLSFSNVSFTRYSGWIQYYYTLFYPTTVLATRFGFQSVVGNDLPVQTLLSIGGNSTLRGYSSDRFIDKTSALFNAELRFPIYWRFGGVLGVDAGRVWSSATKFDLRNWAWNPTVGLRFYMNTFVVRLDVGFGRETTGLYFNFGQIF